MEVYDVCVVGAGVEGSSTARYLASRGKRTLLLEQFTLPHSFGSSHGDSRMFRYSYAQDVYANFMPEALSLWDEIEQMSEKPFIKKSGLLTIRDPPYEDMANVVRNVKRHGQPCFELTADEAMARFPVLKLSPDEKATFEPTSGFIHADIAVKALQDQFVKFGGILRDGEKVLEVKPGPVVRIVTNKGTFRARNVVLTPGPWINRLLYPLGISLPLTIQRIGVPYWEVCSPELYSFSSGLPIFSFLNPFGKDDWNILGFPTVKDPNKIKIVPNLGRKIQDPDIKVEGTMEDVYLTRTMEVIKAKLRGIRPKPISLEPCYYTVTPDRNFVIDRHPHFHNVIIGAGFSGHGFKMAPVVGKLLSQLALRERPDYDIAPFRISRFQNVMPKASL